MVHGREGLEYNRERLYEKTRQLVKSFEDKFRHTKCPDLIQLQLGTPEASEQYRARGLNQQCEEYIRFVTHMAVELVQEG